MKNMEGSGLGLFQCTILAFAWRNSEKGNPVRIVRVPVEFRTEYLQKTRQKHHRLSCFSVEVWQCLVPPLFHSDFRLSLSHRTLGCAAL
jgi:hypothetical protein